MKTSKIWARLSRSKLSMRFHGTLAALALVAVLQPIRAQATHHRPADLSIGKARIIAKAFQKDLRFQRAAIRKLGIVGDPSYPIGVYIEILGDFLPGPTYLSYFQGAAIPILGHLLRGQGIVDINIFGITVPPTVRNCSLAKLKAAGDFPVCMAKDLERVLRSGRSTFAKCEEKLSRAFEVAEARGGCVVIQDRDAIRSVLGPVGGFLGGAEATPYTDLRNANLAGAHLPGAILTNANLSFADLSGADLSGAALSEADFGSISELIHPPLLLQGGKANLSGANLTNANLSGVVLSGVELDHANLSGAIVTGAILSGANLSFANLSGLDLTGAALSGTTLYGVDLNGVDLSGANLHGVWAIELAGCPVSLPVGWRCTTSPSRTLVGPGANLVQARLSGVDLSGIDLSGTAAFDADLSSANLSNANLSGADLSRTNLSNANLSNANLSNANLAVANLSLANLANVHWDLTICPDQTVSNSNGTNPQSCCGHLGAAVPVACSAQ